MIHQLSQSEADRLAIKPGLTQSISPYLNPGHVLSPPRSWLESLLRGDISWPFFRLRYKNLLRNRFRDEPGRFFSLLDASNGERPLYLTCHCLGGHCHIELAAEFLEELRSQESYLRRISSRHAAVVLESLCPQPPPAAMHG